MLWSSPTSATGAGGRWSESASRVTALMSALSPTSIDFSPASSRISAFVPPPGTADARSQCGQLSRSMGTLAAHDEHFQKMFADMVVILQCNVMPVPARSDEPPRSLQAGRNCRFSEIQCWQYWSLIIFSKQTLCVAALRPGADHNGLQAKPT